LPQIHLYPAPPLLHGSLILDYAAMTQDDLKQILRYCKDSGKFHWLSYRSPKAKAGSEAGCLRPDGYIQLMINGKNYYAHRLAYLYVLGRMPINFVDHKNGKRNDNVFSNLRLANGSQNQHNQNMYSNNSTGYKGVYFDASNKRYKSQISIKGKRIHIGRFDTLEEASKAYIEKAKELHGRFAKI